MDGRDSSKSPTSTWLSLMGQAAVTAFTGLLMGGFSVYKLYFPTDTTKPKSSDPQPSQEVLLLMMMFSATVPLVVSGYLVCCIHSLYNMNDRWLQIGLSLRFDYTRALRSNTITAPIITSTTKFAKLPPYPKPFFNAALSTLAVILLNFGLSRLHPSTNFKDTGLIIYALCIPATIVGVRMMIIAGKEGVWNEFMAYTELWVS